jgi:hypothetical protein
LPLTENGLPLGVLSTNIYASHFNAEQKQPGRPIEQKQSYRWLRDIDMLVEVAQCAPETELIAVGDRESDMIELFDYRRRKAPHIHLLVRARCDRRLQDESRKLFGYLKALPVMAVATISVPRKPHTRHMAPVEMWALMLIEENGTTGAKPLCGVLLTSVPIESHKQAMRCLRWYMRRWRIEEWHRVLKSGCRVQAHQHRSAAKLACAIAIDTVIAWRAMLLTLLGREAPDLNCELIFEPWECRLLGQLQSLVAPETMRGSKNRAAAWHG